MADEKPRVVDAVIRDDWGDPDRWEVSRDANGKPISVSVSGKMWDRVRDQGGSLKGLVEELLSKDGN